MSAVVWTLLAGVSSAPAAEKAMAKPTELGRWEDFRDDLVTTGAQSLWNVYLGRDDVSFYRTLADLKSQRRAISRRALDDRCRPATLKRYVALEGSEPDRAVRLVVGKNTARSLFRPETDCGWVSAEHLVLHERPVADGKSGIRRKVIVVFDWRTLRNLLREPDAAVNQAVFERAALYMRPSRDADKRGTLAMVTFAYVYKMIEIDGERWYMVSSQDLLATTPKTQRKRTWGWIPDASVVQWDTTEAVWPHPKRAREAHIYPTVPDLARAVTDPTAGIVTIRDTAFGKPGPTRPLNAMPYPLVNPEQSTGLCQRRGVGCASVAFVGAIAVGDQGLIRAPEVVTRKQRDLGTMKGLAENAMKNLNILFVIDATRSMQGFIDGIQQLATQLRRAMQDEKLVAGATVRFGVVVYRDNYALNDERQGRIQVKPLSEDLGSVARWMQNVEATNYDEDDRPEALSCGLVEAGRLFAEAGASGQQNVLVVVGDQPSARGRDCAVEALSQAVRTLAPHRPWAVHAFGLEHDRANLEGFFADVAAVTAKLGPADVVRQRRAIVPMGRESAIVDELAGTIREMGAQMTEFVDGYEELAAGAGTEVFQARRAPASDVGYAMTRAVKDSVITRYVQLEHVTRDEAEQLWQEMVSRHATIHVEGWMLLSDREQKPVTQKVVLYDRPSVRRYITTLDEMLNDPDTDNLLELWLNLCSHLVADKSNVAGSVEARRAACTRFRTGLRFLDQHKILQRTPDEIQRWLHSETNRRDREQASRHVAQLMAAATDIRDRLREYLQPHNDKLWFDFGHRDEQYIWLLLPDDLL